MLRFAHVHANHHALIVLTALRVSKPVTKPSRLSLNFLASRENSGFTLAGSTYDVPKRSALHGMGTLSAWEFDAEQPSDYKEQHYSAVSFISDCSGLVMYRYHVTSSCVSLVLHQGVQALSLGHANPTR